MYVTQEQFQKAMKKMQQRIDMLAQPEKIYTKEEAEEYVYNMENKPSKDKKSK